MRILSKRTLLIMGVLLDHDIITPATSIASVATLLCRCFGT